METKEFDWSEPKPPTDNASHYDHTTCKTPLGELKIEWKSWKNSPSYDVILNGGEVWIGCEYNLEKAKEIAINYIKIKSIELINFLK